MKIPLSSHRHVPLDGDNGIIPTLLIIIFFAAVAGWFTYGALRDYRKQADRRLSKKMRRKKKSQQHS